MKKYIIIANLLLACLSVSAQKEEIEFEHFKEKFTTFNESYVHDAICNLGFGEQSWKQYAQLDKTTNEAQWMGLYGQLVKFKGITQKKTFPELLRLFKHDDAYKGQAYLGLINVDYLSPKINYTTLNEVLAATSNPLENQQLFIATILGTPGNDLIKIDKQFLLGDFQKGDSLILKDDKSDETYSLSLDDDTWVLPHFKEDKVFTLSLHREGVNLKRSKLFVHKVTQSLSGNKITYVGNSYCTDVEGGGYELPYYDPTGRIPVADYSFTATATIPYDIPTGTNPVFYNGWVENDRLSSPYGKAKVSIVYAEGRNYLKKPLIFLDGYEPFNDILQDRNDQSSYMNYQTRQFPQLWCEICQPGPAAGKLVKDYLREGCYDIVIVNWHGGADFVQRNAFALIEVLNQINELKVGDEPNILVGPSMGGVIANYALTYMEANEGAPNVKAHEVSVFVSDDAPLYGANIPIGVQYAVAHLYWNLVELNSLPLQNLDDKEHQAYMALLAISSPCALQILSYSIFGSSYVPDDGSTNNRTIYTYQQYIDNIGNTDINITELRHHPFFDQLQTELINMGHFPKKCQLLAMGNGSGNLHPHVNFNLDTQVNENMLPESTIFKIDEGATAQVIAKALPTIGTMKVITDVDLALRSRQVVKINGQGNMAADHAPGGFVSMLDQLDNGSTARVYTKHFCHEYINSTLGFDRTWTNQNGNFELTLCDKTPEQYMPYTAFDRIYFPCYDNTKHTWIPQDFLDFLDATLKNMYFQNRAFNNGELNVAAKEKMIVGQQVVTFKPVGEVTFANGGLNGMRLSAGQEIKFSAGTVIKPSSKLKAYVNASYGNSCANPKSRMIQQQEATEVNHKAITDENRVVIYPNPASDRLNFIVQGRDEIKELAIVDLTGHVLTQLLVSSSRELYTGDLPNGIYFVRIIFMDGSKSLQKVVIQH